GRGGRGHRREAAVPCDGRPLQGVGQGRKQVDHAGRAHQGAQQARHLPLCDPGEGAIPTRRPGSLQVHRPRRVPSLPVRPTNPCRRTGAALQASRLHATPSASNHGRGARAPPRGRLRPPGRVRRCERRRRRRRRRRRAPSRGDASRRVHEQRRLKNVHVGVRASQARSVGGGVPFWRGQSCLL
ncbi:unnamed protein product, partial [Ectocarpus fasciculatus]